MGNGSFGIKRELTIINSKAREVFTPHQPIDVIQHLFGRETEVAKLIGYINTPGQHALLYGDRGVGKSSLAKTASKLIFKQIIKGKLYEKRCCSTDVYSTIFEKPLKDAGIEFDLEEYSKSHDQEGTAKIGVGFASSDITSKRTNSQKYIPKHKIDSPSWVVDKIKDINGLLLLDEADSIVNKADKKKIAETIKLLSDVASPFKVLIVGIAKTGEEITAGHPSVERCLKETFLSRMSPEGLQQIIITGASKLKLVFDSEVIDIIVDISAGYPHFTHLIALKCAEDAIANGRKHINKDNLNEALKLAVDESEGVLRRMYDNSVRSTNRKEDYIRLLLAAAQCQIPEFTSMELRVKLTKILGIEVKQKDITAYISRLVSTEEGTILRRTARGVYQFTDPRMPSFIKMKSGL